MDVKQFSEQLFKKAKEYGFCECEIYCSSNDAFSVRIREQEVREYKNAVSGGIGFRGLFDGKMGYSYSERMELDCIDTLLLDAKINSELIENEDVEIIFEGSVEYLTVNNYNEKLKDITAEDKVKLALQLEEYAKSLDSRIRAISHCVVSSGDGSVAIANSKGLMLEKDSNYMVVVVYAEAVENEVVKVGGDVWFGNDFSKFDYKQVAKNAVDDAVSKLNATSVKSDKYNVVIKNEAMKDLLTVYTPVFFAEEVQKGFSKLKGKLNSKIANDNITICDYAVYEDNISNSSFDSEGVACKNKDVIKDGVLQTYLYNLKSATKDNVESTGNGFKGSFAGTVVTDVTNFFVKKGDMSYDELVKQLGTGLIIDDLAGLHSGANTVSGDFSLSASGHYVENGEIKHAVEQITIASNFFELLTSVENIADDIKFSPSGVGSPSILFNNISISGE